MNNEKGTLYINDQIDAERLITLLAKNGYKVQVEILDSIDDFDIEYKIKFKRKDEYGL